jgi:hypothetical protein
VVDLPWSTWPMKTMLRWGLFAIEGGSARGQKVPLFECCCADGAADV